MHYICEYCGNCEIWEYKGKCNLCGYIGIHIMRQTFITKDCPICLEDIDENELFIFRCGHNTCKKCSEKVELCVYCKKSKVEIYNLDKNTNIILPKEQIEKMPKMSISKDNYKYIIMFI
jgi:hypothetical protein